MTTALQSSPSGTAKVFLVAQLVDVAVLSLSKTEKAKQAATRSAEGSESKVEREKVDQTRPLSVRNRA